MEMKRLEISKLMDEYQDNEFFPEGESACGIQAVKDRVLPQAKGKRSHKKLWVVGALAAVMAMLVGAGYPFKFVQSLASDMKIGPFPDGTVAHITEKEPVVLEDGRIWFIANNEHIDITDLIDEETPYIYDGCDPENGITDYIIVGGTPEKYGWYEHIDHPDAPFYSGFGSYNFSYDYYTKDGVVYQEEDLTPEQRNQALKWEDGWETHMKDPAWLVNASLELNIALCSEASELLYGTDTATIYYPNRTDYSNSTEGLEH